MKDFEPPICVHLWHHGVMIRTNLLHHLKLKFCYSLIAGYLVLGEKIFKTYSTLFSLILNNFPWNNVMAHSFLDI